MPFNFCPQCGTKLQPGFNFCPSCGEKLAHPVDKPEESNAHDSLATTPVTTRPALKKTRNSLRLEKEGTFNFSDASLSVVSPAKRLIADTSGANLSNTVGPSVTPPKQQKVSFKLEPTLGSSSPPAAKSPRPVRQKVASKQTEEAKELNDKTYKKVEDRVDGSPKAPVPSPNTKSPLKGKSKGKKAKHAAAVEPLQDGEELTDRTGEKWKLVKLFSQSTTELLYEVMQTSSNSKDVNHVLKLGAKDGRIFNEQNFLQRAAKPASVEKWIKQNKMDFLGIPSCVGFGFHSDSYRFLVFPNMGRSLQSIMEEKHQLLSEVAVLQLTCRILDVLQYIHSNEYVHGDISAENVYIKPVEKSQVYLVGYCHAFRYCPGGKHVEYHEDSRTPHEGTVELISLDAHKGAAPSRRSDLQSLGYCMLHWHTGPLPWMSLDNVDNPEQVATQKQRYMEDVPALLRHCFGKKKVSSAFHSYLTTVMALQYSEEPDCSALRKTLSDALLKLGASPEQPLSF